MSKPREKFRLKVLDTDINILSNKITSSSITTNARLQQVTFTCILKNLKMLAGYQSFFFHLSHLYLNHIRGYGSYFSPKFYRKPTNVWYPFEMIY